MEHQKEREELEALVRMQRDLSNGEPPGKGELFQALVMLGGITHDMEKGKGVRDFVDDRVKLSASEGHLEQLAQASLSSVCVVVELLIELERKSGDRLLDDQYKGDANLECHLLGWLRETRSILAEALKKWDNRT